jgi:hypothetical protein
MVELLRRLRDHVAMQLELLVTAGLAALIADAPEPECHLCTKPLDPTTAVGDGPWYCSPACSNAVWWARYHYGHTARKP